MSDLIDRRAAIEAMCFACGRDCDKSKFVYNTPQYEQVIMCPEHYALSTLPSVQPERPKGEWIHQSKFSRIECDQCGKVFRNTFAPKNFCPNCGADMRGEQDGR